MNMDETWVNHGVKETYPNICANRRFDFPALWGEVLESWSSMRGTDWVTGVQVQREIMRLFRKWYFILFEVLLLTFGMIRAQVFYGVFLRVFSQSQCQNSELENHHLL